MSRKKIDVKGGDLYGGGNIVVIEEVYNSDGKIYKKRRFLCKCVCGMKKEFALSHLRHGNTKSCGCVSRKETSERLSIKNVIGSKYGRLLVIEELPQRGNYVRWFHCLCDCGNYHDVCLSSLRIGQTTSCGCVHREKIITHDMSNSRTYNTWSSMKERCLNKNNNRYLDYGGRGIKVCDRWLVFENFYEDMGERPEGTTLDRINNNGNYCKENCRWATNMQQASNRRDNHYVLYNGKKHTISHWARILGINRGTLFTRIKRGWSEYKALSTPVHRRN